MPIPSKKLVYGRNLRKNSTVWESKLWKHLSDKILGVRFKRQVYIGGFLVDFCCNAKKLIIELDGAHHKGDVGRFKDQERSAFLKREGYKILRFWNSEVDKDINKVLDRIIIAIK